jgi:phosphate-selective porin OprO/OprP
VGLRRARIGAEGNLAIGGRYVGEIDLATGEVVLRDLFGALDGFHRDGEWRAGHYLEPFSLELGTSDNIFPFMERSPINVLDPERSWGFGLFSEQLTESSLFSVGVFHGGSDVNDFQGGEGSSFAVTGKLTAAPILEDDGRRLLHVGIAVSERVPTRVVVVINQQPRTSLIDFVDSARSPFAPVIRVPSDFQQLVNLQTAMARGSFWTQAEWYGTWIDQRHGDAVFLYGFHADCGYFLTGEHRSYSGQSGTFGPVRVRRPVFRCFSGRDRERGWGAWEVVARFSYVDSLDAATPTDSDGRPVGILLSDATFGVNWYMADHL